jgi:signal transduction histidine kinase
MKRSTDGLIALQFLAVALPIALVLLAQLAADSRRAEALAESRPLRILASEARANYRTFTNGAADAVDTGALGRKSAEALDSSAALLARLAALGQSAALGDAPRVVADLAHAVDRSGTLAALMPLRPQIMQGDRLTREIDASFEARDEAVVRGAIASAITQKRAVTAALLITCGLSVWFVLATRRRLKRQLDADAAIERQRRAEVEAISVRFRMATEAARAGVYELQEQGSRVWWSDTMSALYGQSTPGFQPTLAEWLALIHPADRDAAEQAMLTALRERQQLRTHYRVLLPDDSVRHIESLAAVIADAAGASPRLVGIDLDVTERVAAAQREDRLQLQLREASRNAGMAEVATSVLHNVGNVLNSVNVSAGIVTDKLRRSKVAGLGQVATLLQEHHHDLGNFVGHDERGRQLPVYLAGLSKHLLADQSATLLELDSLRKNIDHIKEIVTMQQSYAKLAGVTETVSVTQLVDECLHINSGGFARHAISVVREFATVPQINVDKHKVLQILVNLLRNAKHACQQGTQSPRRVTVGVGPCDCGVSIAITDNGVGIPPDNMTRIFTYGFTTKKEGHGFGLHSGALAAREMGGALRAASEGPGHGATFTLELPLNPPGTTNV